MIRVVGIFANFEASMGEWSAWLLINERGFNERTEFGGKNAQEAQRN